MRVKILVLSVLTLALVACGGDNVPKKTEVARAEIKEGQNFGVIKVTRDSSVELSCSGSVVNVAWDANKPGVEQKNAEIQIWIEPNVGEPILFVEGGLAGEAKTGNWVNPGVKFVAKLKKDNSIVDEFIVAGKKC
ncbi:hypothetical protein PMI34_02118 [Pseudomonas sp. GM74]|uniref:hypothetical protein n=1 Tax=Pseudomonas sp. GM74 TaxID=1144336 RepID=UPI000270AB36|nr:hypothetical protein [Pseudomonas sp. GM74]EJM92638.1 hypothetical protein PMI34_02118 [Pseudomonas sp. GM74]